MTDHLWRFECGGCGEIETLREERPAEPCIMCDDVQWRYAAKLPEPVLSDRAYGSGLLLMAAAGVVALTGIGLLACGIPLTHRSLGAVALALNGAGITLISGAMLRLTWQRWSGRRAVAEMNRHDDPRGRSAGSRRGAAEIADGP